MGCWHIIVFGKNALKQLNFVYSKNANPRKCLAYRDFLVGCPVGLVQIFLLLINLN